MKIALSIAASAVIAVAPSAAQPGPDARAAEVEAQMTDAERFSLLHTLMPIPFGSQYDALIPEGVEAMAGYAAGVPRLAVPPLRMTDASLGVTNPLQLRQGDVATAMPSGLAIASSFDAALAYESGKIIGAEARAKGFNVLLGGGVNLARDPRNGRNFEYLGEDPLLAGILAGEAVRGVQSEKVVSTVKHFALNNQETHRSTLNAVIDEAAFRESDLLAFEIAIERGEPGSVMCAYNRVNGPWACGSEFLLDKVLRDDWRYPGWTMSDWGAAHATDYAAKGLDQQSGAQLDKQIWFDAPLKAAVAKGEVPRERIAEMTQRILRSIYAVGADAPLEKTAIDYAKHARVARKAAAKGVVLLKNEGILPLSPKTKTILLVGGHADIGVLSGGGSSQVTPVGGAAALIPVGGPGFLASFGKQLYMPSSPLKALQAALPKTDISYDSGYFPDNAAAAAANADIVIVFATQWQVEALDAGSMSLPGGQDDLIARLAAANPNLIIVLETGNPVLMPWLSQAKAVLEAWYPGQEGGAAIADILTGEINPSGRLPITFPADESQLPRPAIPGFRQSDGTDLVVDYLEGSDVGYRWFARQELTPLFPFGYGLSYTAFAHSAFKLTVGDTPTATFRIANTGRRRGEDTPQIYLTAINGRPVKRLAAFARADLAAGKSATITVEIEPRILAEWTDGEWRIEGGEYEFTLASSAADAGQQQTVALPEKRFGY